MPDLSQLDVSNLNDILLSKKQHIARLSATTGALGEAIALHAAPTGVARPKGQEWKALSAALERGGISIRASSFDFILVPAEKTLDYNDPRSLDEVLGSLIFIEVKTANQRRVKDDFSGFFFALTESEIAAAEQLGDRHKVLLINKLSGTKLLTSVTEILSRSKSTHWQLSVQL